MATGPMSLLELFFLACHIYMNVVFGSPGFEVSVLSDCRLGDEPVISKWYTACSLRRFQGK